MMICYRHAPLNLHLAAASQICHYSTARNSTTAMLDRRTPSRRLPVLPLRTTLDKYLKSLVPFLQEDDAQGISHFDYEMQKRVRMAEEFERGTGRILQDRLVALDKTSPHNWLDDNFWMKYAYLSSRAPLIVNSNWWCLFQHDPTIPTFPIEQPTNTYTFWQVRRASWLLHKVLQYRYRLEKNFQESASSTGIPYQVPFHRCRIPLPGCDALAPTPQRGTGNAQKVILMLRGWLYAITVVKEEEPIPVGNIEKQIWAAIHDANMLQSLGKKAAPVGLLTAHDRDAWAQARRYLLEHSPKNAAFLRTIEESIMVLSLDDYTLTTNDRPSSIKDVVLDAQVRNSSSGMDGHNRWYDKCVSYFVDTSARAGGMGEHSPCDGLVVGNIMFDSLGENIDPKQYSSIPESATSADLLGSVDRLDWVADKQIETWCVEAENVAKAVSEDSDASMLCFEEFGATWLKETALVSPDAFVQMAMQLAWYLDQGNFTATYETATTHMFIRGRTEVIRTLSAESRAFVKAMTDTQCSYSARQRLLQEAIRAHNSYTRDAIRGRGVDRHLLGLRLLIAEGETAELFEDPLFTRSQAWRLSTSGLYNGERFLGTGFGTPYTDGYGVQYLINPNNVKFGIESKRACSITSTERFKSVLVKSLRDMHNLYSPEKKRLDTITARL